jgi:HAD superfamily hydrolase (TIGR01509 family)
LSFELKACKPSPKIYTGAANKAQVRPDEIFFVDDTPGHVEGARRAGFDAVPYTTTPRLVAELRARGLEFNY